MFTGRAFFIAKHDFFCTKPMGFRRNKFVLGFCSNHNNGSISVDKGIGIFTSIVYKALIFQHFIA